MVEKKERRKDGRNGGLKTRGSTHVLTATTDTAKEDAVNQRKRDKGLGQDE